MQVLMKHIKLILFSSTVLLLFYLRTMPLHSQPDQNEVDTSRIIASDSTKIDFIKTLEFRAYDM
ncbi:hypothetical protein GCM10027429_25110 [Marivirga atlantica]|jgi:hypothetical protein